MQTAQFKTTIKCSGCVANATSHLNKAAGENNWEVDVQNPQKVLTVKAEGNINEEEIIKAVKEAGYKAERLG